MENACLHHGAEGRPLNETRHVNVGEKAIDRAALRMTGAVR